MKWITRERPKIDRIACPWLIKKFVDEQAEFIYVPFDQVKKNFESYKEQSSKIIVFKKVNIAYNHEWLEQLNFADIHC